MSTASPAERPPLGRREKSLGGVTASKPEERVKREVFSPTETQEEFIFDTSDQILLSGTVGAGKSRIGCEKGYLLNCKYPGNRGLIVRKAFFDLKLSTIRQTLLEEVIPDSHIVSHNKGEHVIEHLTGTSDPTGEPVTSEIHYHGLDSGRDTGDDNIPRKIGSMQFGWVFVEEGTETNEAEWSQLLGRLRYTGKVQNGYLYRVPKKQIFTATNPASPVHYLYKRFIGDDAVENSSVYRMKVYDNPGVEQEYIDRMEAFYTGIYRERLLEGKWVGAEGMVYDEWHPNEHIIHPDDLPEEWVKERTVEYSATGEKGYWVTPPDEWKLYRVVDHGFTHPFVTQWWARSPDDTVIMFRELYKSQERTDDISDDIRRMTPDGRTIVRTWADHDAEGNEILRQNGISTTDAKKAVADGIQAVKSRMAYEEPGTADLYIMEGARCHRPDGHLLADEKPTKTVDEIPSYKWDPDADDDEPIKEDDHGCDCMRYFVYSLDGGINLSEEEKDEYRKLAEAF